MTDGLTGVPNRRYLEEKLLQEIARCCRQHNTLTLVLCDIDFFKQFNDHYGHVKGDHCLIDIAQTLQKQLQRAGDFIARYGGEEFAVVLPSTDMEGAKRLTENMRSAVEAMAIAHEVSPVAPVVTLSFGIACIHPNRLQKSEVSLLRNLRNQTLYRVKADLLNTADQALYRAKEAGRNCVVAEYV